MKKSKLHIVVGLLCTMLLSSFIAGCSGGSGGGSTGAYTCQCKDGTSSNSCGIQGACSGHGGIANPR